MNHGDECQTELWNNVPTPSTSTNIATVTNNTIPKRTSIEHITRKLEPGCCYSSSDDGDRSSLIKNNKNNKNNRNNRDHKENRNIKDNSSLDVNSSKSNDKSHFDERKTQDKSGTGGGGGGSTDAKSRQKKRPNTPSNNAIESLDGEDIGAVFENPDSPGLISEYENPDISQLKERFNFASFDCGASVLKANKEAKGTSAILSESKDTYVLNQCSATKFVIVELCEDILIDYVAMANFEFFSSTFKDFRISISDWYPPKNGWTVLGQYKAKNSREIQVGL